MNHQWQQFEQKLQLLKKQITEDLSKFLQQDIPVSLYEPIKYAMQSGGKRLRPILLLLSTEALGGDVEAARPAALAIELLHNFTLVHDDIMDNDDTRRGRPTVHQKWDTDVALLAGDGLVALAYQSLLKTPTDRLIEISRIFTAGIIELCEGQALDREFETRERVSMDEYLEMITKKTGRLLSMCAQIGAIIAHAPERAVQALKIFGESLGIAFQIQDDLLDITSDPAVLGKDFGSDIRQRKKTFLLVHALKNANLQQSRRLQQILSREKIGIDSILQIRELFQQIGSIDYARQKIREHIAAAENSLAPIEAMNGKTGDLKKLLNLVLRREA